MDVGPNVDRNYLQMLSIHTLEQIQKMQQQLRPNTEQKKTSATEKPLNQTRALLLFVSRDKKEDEPNGGKGSSNDGSGLFYLIGHVDWVKQVGKPISDILKGRGGGNQGKYQGKASSINVRTMEQARNYLKSYVSGKKRGPTTTTLDSNII